MYAYFFFFTEHGPSKVLVLWSFNWFCITSSCAESESLV